MSIGLALRPEVFKPLEILKIAENIFSKYFFIPDVSNEIDPIQLSFSILLKNKETMAGPGVIRINEMQLNELIRQIKTINELVENRFFLGVGLGSVKEDVSQAISSMREKILKIVQETGVKIFVATLREGLAKKVKDISDGIILNFSTFEHAKRVSSVFKYENKKVISYFKIFIGQTQDAAIHMAINELQKYASFPQYYELFKKEGVIEDILALYSKREEAIRNLQAKGVIAINPSPDFIKNVSDVFYKNGVDVLALYPYFSPTYNYDKRFAFLKEVFL
ncbi:MAG: hypothetical protein GU362_05095 [Thaumarchaeota archaeon]|jgi:hypothetical protein|nr:hypothetical protein [Nitrososphaerota archaeon]